MGGLSTRETFRAFGEIHTRLHVRRGPDAMGCRRGSAFRKSSLSIVAFLVNSRLKCNTCGPSEDFGRCSIGEAFARSIIQFFDHPCKVSCTDR